MCPRGGRVLKQRHLPATFRWKGNRRKRALRAPAAVSPRRAEGRSLDSFKHLATSENFATGPQTFADYVKAQTNAVDRRKRAWVLYAGLLDTLKGLAHMEGVWHRCDTAAEAKGILPLTKKPRRSRRWSAAKDMERLSGCQSEWIGFKPKCCESRAVAVPIGCNHRLCPLCNHHRAERYRTRVMTLFHKLSNPWLLTLTVPSPREMSREVLDRLRTRLKAFLKQQKAFLLGGVYSIEVTRNKRERTWHPHVHILVDIADPRQKLPWREFAERKWRLEFEWFLLTQGKRKGARRWSSADWEEWCGGRDASARLRGPSAGVHRRVLDLRPVTRDRKAAFEVLKYMSKAASFIGDADALRQLLVAIRGVRQIQTFGSCYGFSFEDDAPVESHLQCECGANVFEPIGRLGMGMVKLSPEGTWYVRDDAPVHGKNGRDGTYKRRRQT